MILGQAAGVAARLAIESKRAVQEIDTKALTAKLRSQGAVMEYVASPQTTALELARKNGLARKNATVSAPQQ